MNRQIRKWWAGWWKWYYKADEEPYVPPEFMPAPPALVSAVSAHNSQLTTKNIQSQLTTMAQQQGLLNKHMQQHSQVHLNGPTGPNPTFTNPFSGTWEKFLAGRDPTSALAHGFLAKHLGGDCGEPLALLLGDLLNRIKELEDANPWQKSYDQIADEKEAAADDDEDEADCGNATPWDGAYGA